MSDECSRRIVRNDTPDGVEICQYCSKAFHAPVVKGVFPAGARLKTLAKFEEDMATLKAGGLAAQLLVQAERDEVELSGVEVGK